MIEHKVDSIKDIRRKELADEITARDYKVMKIIRQQYGALLEKEYPGETDWYNQQVKKIHELEGRE
jgi:hypothetical protein